MRAAPYDLIADIGGKLYRVQVKYIGPARNRVDVSKKGPRRRVYGPNEIDLLAVWQDGDAYLLKWPTAVQYTMTLTEERKNAYQFEKVLGGILAERLAARSGNGLVEGSCGAGFVRFPEWRWVESVPGK
jgi:hypothetical protein